jgi:hypothetical protein
MYIYAVFLEFHLQRRRFKTSCVCVCAYMLEEQNIVGAHAVRRPAATLKHTEREIDTHTHTHTHIHLQRCRFKSFRRTCLRKIKNSIHIQKKDGLPRGALHLST